MKRCEHCTSWQDTVYAGESESGWGCWYGFCRKTGEDGKSLDRACTFFSPKEEPIEDVPGQIMMFNEQGGKENP